MTILAGTIDFLDFCTMVRKMTDTFSDDDLKKSFWKFAEATPEDVKKLIFKSTGWWYGYQTSVKQAVKLESQGFDGVLDVTCIRGGPITRLEAEEMGRIMQDAKSDCAKSGISVTYEISYVSYREFLLVHEPWCVEPTEQSDDRPVQSHGDAPGSTDEVASGDDGVVNSARGLGTSSVPTVAEVEELRAALNRKDKELAAKDEDMVAKLSAKDEQLAAKDEDMVAKLSAKDEQLAAKDKELEDLRAQLKMPLEGVPPK
jgi:hypothetical protein